MAEPIENTGDQLEYPLEEARWVWEEAARVMRLHGELASMYRSKSKDGRTISLLWAKIEEGEAGLRAIGVPTVSFGDAHIPAKVTTTKYAQIPLTIGADEPTDRVRKLLRAAGERVGIIIIQEWLSHPADYDIDIDITLREKPRA